MTRPMALPDGDAGPRATVVLVDDASDFRWVVRRSLERSGLYSVVAEAEDGFTGVEAVMDHAPDLVLLDIDMPRMNGLEALGLMVRHRPATQVVMLTAMTGGDLLDAAMAGGALGIIRKGSSLVNIVAQLRGLTHPDPNVQIVIESLV